jgi:hypothetical protein
MPLDWKIRPDEQLVYAVATGEISADEIQAFLGSVIADQAMPYGKIFDIRQVTALAAAQRLAEVGDTVRLYDKMKLGPIGPLAIVAGSVAERISYAEAFLRAATAQRPVRLFEDPETARAWLIATRDARP